MKRKINWLLILQGWTMLWVVIRHAFLGKHNEGPEWETMLGTIAFYITNFQLAVAQRYSLFIPVIVGSVLLIPHVTFYVYLLNIKEGAKFDC